MREPEVALAFTPDPWVEEVHRHLSDHGGGRVRSLVIEAGVALEESYDVLVAGHRWPALTRALVADVHARGRAVLGVYDREEPASRTHLLAIGVDALVESDAGGDGFVRALMSTVRPRAETPVVAPSAHSGRVVVVGGPPGVGRTEIAIQYAVANRALLLDADDVAPAIAQRLGLPIEPNLRTAIDAVEHGRGEIEWCVFDGEVRVVGGLPNAKAWAHVRPGEVLRVIDMLAGFVVVDGAGVLDDVGGVGTRSRYATARALVGRADELLVVCDASPLGVARVGAWIAEARVLAPDTEMTVVANRAPSARFQRGELFEELMASCALRDVVFVPYDARVADAAWNGEMVARGAFTKALA